MISVVLVFSWCKICAHQQSLFSSFFCPLISMAARFLPSSIGNTSSTPASYVSSTEDIYLEPESLLTLNDLNDLTCQHKT